MTTNAPTHPNSQESVAPLLVQFSWVILKMFQKSLVVFRKVFYLLLFFSRLNFPFIKKTLIISDKRRINADCEDADAGINHNIDELLVGVVKQIRLRERKRKKISKVISQHRKTRYTPKHSEFSPRNSWS